jgi:NAD(P)-dependent dehydrogenase (short-subunit alcohol dehydrogenase family)
MAGIVAGKTAIVTGAGRGIGRGIAMLLAKEGARVVVCDIGASLQGEGSDTGPAQETVNVIKQAGGEAIASTLSITEPKNAEAVVKMALEAFGRIDILVNNAGILRDVIFHKMSWSDWSDVIAVHLNGSFNMSRAVAPLFREQNSGAFVHMTSTSGLVGNFGQANYMAAKLGIMGLSRGIALDMARFNVRSNCIAPFAFTRMIESIPTQSEQDKLRILRCSQRHHRADSFGPQQRDLPVQSAAAGEDHPSRGRMDARADCSRAKTGLRVLVHAAGAVGRRIQLGPDLGVLVRRRRLHRVGQ